MNLPPLTNDYKHIILIHLPDKPKTHVLAVQTKNQEVTLGVIKWFAPWRQYCFFPAQECVFSKSCMVDINDVITKLKEDRAKK